MMQQFFQFVSNHLGLFVLFLVTLLAVIVYELIHLKRLAQRISPQDAVTLINRETPYLVDVRDPSAFKEGHILGARNIPSSELDNHLSKLEKQKEKQLLLYCANGQQSASVGAKLKKMGYNHLTILAGGLNAWREAKLPVVQK